MTYPTAIEDSVVTPDLNLSPNFEFPAVDHSGKYSYPKAIAQLKDCGYMSLVDMQELSYADLNNVFEEIKCWCVYGNHDPKKLHTKLNTLNP